MNPSNALSISQMYEDHAEKLKLTWVAAIGVDRKLELTEPEFFGPDVVGHFNLIYSMQRRASDVYNSWDEGVKNVFAWKIHVSINVFYKCCFHHITRIRTYSILRKLSPFWSFHFNINNLELT